MTDVLILFLDIEQFFTLADYALMRDRHKSRNKKINNVTHIKIQETKKHTED